MAKGKKSRKIGLIGVRKSPDFKRVEKEKRLKKVLGKPAGSRNNQPLANDSSVKAKLNNDPRLGSKKPVDLFTQTDQLQKIKPKVKLVTPQQELTEIENDEKLSLLLNKLDSGTDVDTASQNYIDDKLKRHKQLCEILGIADDDDTDETTERAAEKDDDELLATFEKINVNRLKDF